MTMMWRLRYEQFRRDYDVLSAAVLATPFELLMLAVGSLLVASALLAVNGGASYVGRLVHCFTHAPLAVTFQ